MTDLCIRICQLAAAGGMIAALGVCLAGLIVRFVRVMRGQESADALGGAAPRPSPAGEMALCAAAALLTRLALYLLAHLMLCAYLGRPYGFFETLDDLWYHWDTRHYVGIAESGYPVSGDDRLRLVFFPFFPMVMRAASLLTGGDLFAGGLLVSLACGSVAAALIYDLGYMHGGRTTARLSAAYFLLSPMSVFLCCAYTEALFICLTLGCVCALRRGHAWLAALLGALSSFTRMPGVIAAGLLIIHCLARWPRRRLTLRAALACAGQVLLVFSGFFAYLAVNYAVTGDPFTYLIYQRENWFQEPGSFWQTAMTTVEYTFAYFGQYDWFFCWVTQLGAMLAIALLMALYARRLPFDLAAYSLVYIAVVLSPTWLLSGPRYLYALCAWPLLVCSMTKRRGVHAALLAAHAALLIVYTYGYTIVQGVL